VTDSAAPAAPSLPFPPAAPARDPAQVLRAVFGYDRFRGAQEAVIRHVMAGGDALVLMPTGGGKSLCYQIPALCREGVGVVVSPLIALMQDQVAALRQAGVAAAFLNSTLSAAEAWRIEEHMRRGGLDLVYVAPERLVTPRFLELCAQTRLALFAIDEAHCVSQWGHDFRPEYGALSVLHERFPAVPRIALTATADGPTRRDIVDKLALGQARVFATGFDRPNIRYRVMPKHDAAGQLRAFLDEHPDDAGIVYCLSRKKVDETAAALAARGRVALPYHAGLDAGTRQRHQERFVREEGVVIVATIAFGMGIDKPNVRFVAHLDLPRSLEAYYQETGRAGRDGLPADAWMVYGLGDVVALRQMLAAAETDGQRKRVEQQKLDAMLGFCETTGCRRAALLGYFGEPLAGPCGNCDTCLEPVATWDGTVAAQKALSCVYRTGQRFGAGHLVDVLLGRLTERVQKLGHERLSTFGIGQELGQSAWFSVYRQLVAAGLLTVDLEGHGGLRLAPASRAVLRGEQTMRLRVDPAARRKKDRAARAPGDGEAAADGATTPAGRALWDALRALRLELARAQGVPPYVIFHDTTLLDLVRRCPRRREELADVPGIGERKLERYGDAVLATIAAHAGAP
jgi:ATP-dependent DNA helicase RecQ